MEREELRAVQEPLKERYLERPEEAVVTLRAAGELGLAYATVCVVDNFANGISGEELTLAELEAGRAANREKLTAAIASAVPELG